MRSLLVSLMVRDHFPEGVTISSELLELVGLPMVRSVPFAKRALDALRFAAGPHVRLWLRKRVERMCCCGRTQSFREIGMSPVADSSSVRIAADVIGVE